MGLTIFVILLINREGWLGLWRVSCINENDRNRTSTEDSNETSQEHSIEKRRPCLSYIVWGLGRERQG